MKKTIKAHEEKSGKVKAKTPENAIPTYLLDREGKGFIYYKNGDVFEGDFTKDKQTGKGVYKYKDGEKYEGDFNDGVMEGFGIYYYNNGDRYEGDFRGGIREGNGKLFYGNDLYLLLPFLLPFLLFLLFLPSF